MAPGSSARTSARRSSGRGTASSASTTSRRARSRTSQHLRDDAFVFLHHDVSEPIVVDEPLDFVYHLAALASPIDYLRLPLHSLKAGSYGTHHALGLAKWKRARFLLASTSEVYGDPQMHPQPETYWGNVNPIGPRGVYDEAKRYAEALTMAYHRQQGVDTSIVRIFNTYGPRMRPNDGRAIPNFMSQALAEKPLTVYGDGSQTRSFCYVDDLIRGLVLLAESGEHLPVNIGNPGEYTILQLAEAVLAATGSPSQILFESLPVDDPQVRQPDITRARQILGWEPEIPLDEGLRRTLASLGEGTRRVRRAGAMAAALAVAVAVVLAPTASASSSLRIGIFDDGVVLYGEPDLVFPQLQKTRTQLLRVNLWWSGPGISVATRKPKRPADPNDPAYNWDTYDRTVRFSIVNGIIPIFSIIGTPPWANAAKGWNVAPTNARDLQNFAAAAQKRYSGTFVNADGVVLPRVSLWMAWNEPNNPVFLKPQYRRVGKTWTIQSGRDYAKLCNAVVSGIKSVQRTSKVACGATGPRGNNNPNSSRPSVSPIPFLRAMKAGGAKGFDAYAQHPYYGSPAETPSTKPPPGLRGQPPTAVTLGNIDVLIGELDRLYGRQMRVWVTEYGYQTNPTDRIFGVTWSKQAAYLAQAVSIVRANPRIDMFLWFLLRDEQRLSGWQSGLMTYDGKRKPSFAAFQRAAISLGAP